MKGFTKGKGKGAKFIPTNKKKGLKKSDIRKKETLGVKEVNSILRTKQSLDDKNTLTDSDFRALDQELQDAKEITLAMDNGQLPSHIKSQVDAIVEKISHVRIQINQKGLHGTDNRDKETLDESQLPLDHSDDLNRVKHILNSDLKDKEKLRILIGFLHTDDYEVNSL